MIGTKEQAVLHIMEMPEGVKVEVKEWKPKRSGQQNAYYWKLCTEIADKLHQSKTIVHNELLRAYGQMMRIGGELTTVWIPDTDEAEQETLEQEEYHLKPTSYIKQGKRELMRAYVAMIGSRNYNTKEMSILLDGCIQEAKNLGIQTLTPNEIERMRAEDEAIENRRLQKRDTR